MIYRISIGEKNYEVSFNGDFTMVKVNGREVKIDYRRSRGGKLYSILADNVNYEISLERTENGFEAWHCSALTRVEISDEKTERLKILTAGVSSGTLSRTLKAPMPGLIVKVEVNIGQQVKKGDGLIIIEAMKMENELKAHSPGIIKEIKVKPGAPVEKNQILIIFE